jgi:hypothetical protein
MRTPCCLCVSPLIIARQQLGSATGIHATTEEMLNVMFSMQACHIRYSVLVLPRTSYMETKEIMTCFYCHGLPKWPHMDGRHGYVVSLPGPPRGSFMTLVHFHPSVISPHSMMLHTLA